MIEVVGDKGVAGVFTLADGIQPEAFRELHRHILHGVHGQIRLVVQHGGFQLLDEQALAADLGQRRVQQLVATANHRNQTDAERRVKLFETRLNILGLPQGQGALSGGNSQMSTHGTLASNQVASYAMVRQASTRAGVAGHSQAIHEPAHTGNMTTTDCQRLSFQVLQTQLEVTH